MWSTWDAATQLISTRLAGHISSAEVARWEAGLHAIVAAIAPHTGFKLLVDQRGYEMRDMAVHKAMRVVVPHLLASYGMAAAVLDLFPEATISVTRTRGVVCYACATVHHDVAKMTEYARTLNRANQQFFTDVATARAWLLALDSSAFNR